MALIGSVTSSSSNGRSVTLNWSASQDISTNTSKISWELVGSGSAGGWITVSELRVTIDGSQAYYRSSSTHTNCYNGTQLASGVKTITHNADGSRSFTIKVEAGIYNWTINCSGSGTFTLNTIARASTITSASNITLGNNCGITWIPASANFYYKIRFAIGGWNYTTSPIHPNVTTSYTYASYAIPLIVANQLPNSASGTVTASLYTYSNSSCNTQIGSTASRTFTVSVPTSIIPTLVDVNVSLDNSANSVIDGWGVAVAGYTKVKITASARGIYGSTIGSFSVSGGYNVTKSGTSLSYTGSVISSSGNKTFTVTAKDSRLRSSASKTTSPVMFHAYSKPRINSISVTRSSSDATKVIARADWSYASVDGHNSSTAILQYKQAALSSWITYGEIKNRVDSTLSVDFDEASSYNFRIVVTDSLGNKAQEDSFVSTIAVLMDFRAGGKGLGIGKISEKDGMEVALDTTFYSPAEFRDVPEPQVSAYGGKTDTNVMYLAKRYDTGTEVWFGVGSGGVNHGVYSRTLDNWLINGRNGKVYCNSREIHPHKVLWTGGLFMNDAQTITFDGTVEDQENGIALVFCRYDDVNSEVKHDTFITHFVDKRTISTYNGAGHSFMLSESMLEKIAVKYLYIYNDKIVGHASNNERGTGASGITYDNRYWVLSAVYGL